MDKHDRTFRSDRFATDPCLLPSEMLNCLERLAARSKSPIAVSVDADRALQIQGHFLVNGEPAAYFELANEAFACLGRSNDCELRRPRGYATEQNARNLSRVQTFELVCREMPIYRGGVSIAVGNDGVSDSIVVSVPRTRPSHATWGSEQSAERLVRKHWGLDDVGAQWPFGLGRQMWYSSSFVYGSIDRDSWQPVWIFSNTTAENPFDVVVSGDGATLIDAFVTGDGVGLSPVPRYHVRPETGVPDFITWGQTGLLLPEAATGDPARVARALFDRFPKLFGTADSVRQLEFVRTDISTAAPRSYHVLFQQRYGGFAVYGCRLCVHLSATLAVQCVSGNYLQDPQISLDARLQESRAMQMLSVASAAGDDREMVTLNEMSSEGLVVFPSVLAPGGDAVNHLAWSILTPRFHYFVSAESGRIVYRTPTRLDARLTYDANQMPSGETLQFRDGVDLTGGAADPEASSVDAAIADIESAWLLFGWRGWDGRRSDDVAIVDFAHMPDPNASFDSTDHKTRYDRNFTTPEIVAHEFTHGVVHASCRLEYVGEAGALNESFADVFGKLIFPGMDWIIRRADGTTMRNLSAPPIDRYSLLSKNPLDHFSVHSNSGIGNRCAVLICDGAPGRAGVDRELTARLEWDVMVWRMHPWATYLDFSHAMRETVRDLARIGRPGVAVPGSGAASGAPMPVFDSTTVAQVDWALDQVELRPALHSGWFTIPGAFNETRTFFPAAVVPASERVSAVEMLITRRRNADKTELLLGRAIEPGAPRFVDQSGTIDVRIVSHGVGTQSKQFTVSIKNTGGVPFETLPSAYTRVVAPPPANEPAPVDERPTPYIPHWFDNPFFLGRKYGDLIYETVGVSASCTILDVWVELLENANGVLIARGQTRVGEPAAQNGGTGVVLVEAFPGTSSLQVKVRSWHEFGQIVRYRVVYQISGGCVPTSFGYREVDPFTFQ